MHNIADEITSKVAKIKNFFSLNETKNISYRIDSLKRLKKIIKLKEEEIFDALNEDLEKSNFESYITEISLVLKEIDYHIRHLKRWAKPEKRRLPLVLFPSCGKIIKEPYGVVLIIAPWNYPFQLLFNPLIAAISAGNCAVLKTSPYAPATAKVMETIIKESFPENYVTIIHGNREVNQLLLAQRFDYIFFTGSPTLGKVVMEAAAKNLTPVTLELGGKSPCIIDYDANLPLAARRIVWGKTMNAGQTCIAPDYLFVHKKIKTDFVFEIEKALIEMFGEKMEESPDYPRIISSIAMQRLLTYLKSGDIVLGGNYNEDDYFLSLTILENVAEDSPVMRDEIFGPILPLFEFETIDEVISFVNKREKPLALYYFSKNKKSIKRVLSETSSGGVCINDTLIHAGTHTLPFGGVGNSGMGRYHGKYGFDTFSHLKSVVTSSSKIDFKVKYPPYKQKLAKFKRFI
jgi:aldehyde dehydrogenase (NAD+)